MIKSDCVYDAIWEPREVPMLLVLEFLLFSVVHNSPDSSSWAGSAHGCWSPEHIIA